MLKQYFKVVEDLNRHTKEESEMKNEENEVQTASMKH